MARHPKHVTIDGKPHRGPVAMHTCPTTNAHAPIYADASYAPGRWPAIACVSCDYRRTPAGTEQMLEDNKRAVQEAFGLR